MKTQKQIMILGLGHIGASLAAKLSKDGWRVWGWDKNVATMKYCLRKKWVHDVVGADNMPARECGLCVLALPEDAVYDETFLPLLRSLPKHIVITDVFSSKGAATRRLNALCKSLALKSAWSHPLAGREGSGAASADAQIFKNAVVLVDAGSKVNSRVASFWKSVGCRVEKISTRGHQKSIALGSHLMHVIAYSSVRVVARGARLSPSVMGTTRVARSNPVAWTNILLSNQLEVTRAIRVFSRELDRLAKLIESGDAGGLQARLTGARRLREKIERLS